MVAQIISGNEVAKSIRIEIKAEVAKMKAKGIEPGLVVIIVGEDAASQVYVRKKGEACNELGICSETIRLPATTKEDELLNLIDKYNKDPKFDGILVQLPLPKHISEEKVLVRIDPGKDVDGFHPINVGKMVVGSDCYLPCTPHGIQELLVRSGNDPAGKHVVVLGRSNIVGKPVACILIQKAKGADATVTICHSRTKNLADMTRQADILIAAIGSPQFVKADMVKEGVVVIDVGVNRINDPTAKGGARLVGDVDFEAVKEKAKAITPVPGGVGPMTITMLMQNTVHAAKVHHHWKD
ncbi:MAG: bifunctional methylenetetrahydrofolate dehydrogenase/methenyltetrahydrofolate cyclohydrolase FolD [Thermoplasmatota archaeon]|nr:bifunctional methylenetetrahydrofolate dehydrogenase/methenyltetrahydrofolate cyclohydrolase FolD [Candidatus Thermoplasmatota archaeon]MBU1914274.1 bifunctional methylenetetrahydrofolate dehydrogenase/methenyltetrahydrofolate cyclohydrolase FolD [Candidatus Thermoplasmatota archaeon]